MREKYEKHLNCVLKTNHMWILIDTQTQVLKTLIYACEQQGATCKVA